jgi:FKBP-type peptidyl-prolyl cis-trans isomerase
MKKLLIIGAAVLVVGLSACGGGDDSTKDKEKATATATGAASKSVAASAQPGGTPVVLDNPTVTASGLKYVDTVVGTGPSPRPDQSVTVHYTGLLAANGKKFDSSVDRGQPASFAMNGVIPGFKEALSTMKVGGKRRAYIPAALGYGAANIPGIPPNSDLIFDIELIAIK